MQYLRILFSNFGEDDFLWTQMTHDIRRMTPGVWHKLLNGELIIMAVVQGL